MEVVLLEQIRDGSSQLVGPYQDLEVAVSDAVTLLKTLMIRANHDGDMQVRRVTEKNYLVTSPLMPIGYAISVVPVVTNPRAHCLLVDNF